MSFTEEEVEAAWESTLLGETAQWSVMSDQYKKHYVAFANALLAKREGTPIDPENVREGDLIRGTIASSLREHAHLNGGVVEARAHRPGMGGLCVIDWSIEALDDLRLINRPAPKLPTEPGLMIEAYEVRGIAGKWPLRLGHSGYWRSFEKVRGSLVHLPEDITAWKPADLVVREEDSK